MTSNGRTDNTVEIDQKMKRNGIFLPRSFTVQCVQFRCITTRASLQSCVSEELQATEDENQRWRAWVVLAVPRRPRTTLECLRSGCTENLPSRDSPLFQTQPSCPLLPGFKLFDLWGNGRDRCSGTYVAKTSPGRDSGLAQIAQPRPTPYSKLRTH